MGSWKKVLAPLFAALSLAIHAGLVPAASFDCTKAATWVEKAICADPELSQLDVDLNRYYLVATNALEESRTCLKADQLQWLKTVRNACKEKECLKAAYLNRLSELDGFQPGASAIRYIDLPPAPTLVWIIPPLKVAAASKISGASLELTGKLGWAEDGSDIYRLQTESGDSYRLDFPGLRDVKIDRFPDLANERIRHGENGTPAFMIRGSGILQNGGARFDPARCVFFYRMSR